MRCFVLHTVRVSIGCVHSCYVLCCVARSFCYSLAVCFHVVISWVNTWLMSFLISCMFVSCFAHGWWFVYWPCACVFVLCEHMAFVLDFCVPCALMSIVLTPPILLPDYCLICPTCLSSLPSSFACFIVSLCLQSCASSSSLNPICVLSCPVLSSPVLSCPVLSCPVVPCPVLSCPVLSCPVLSCPVQPCLALSCPVLSCLDSHSDGTHSLQRIHLWASNAMLNFSKSVQIKKKNHVLGWPESKYSFSKC